MAFEVTRTQRPKAFVGSRCDRPNLQLFLTERYISVRLQDDTVPATQFLNEAHVSGGKFPPGTLLVKTAVGVDLGIAKLASLSTGETIAGPRFAQKAERKRKILHRSASRKTIGSKNRRKAYHCMARLENRVTNKRSDYQWKLGNNLVRQADAIVFEDLNIKGMSARCKPKQDENGKYIRNSQAAKSGLNKAILDASVVRTQTKSSCCV